jgi:hypothetical protein
MAFPYRPNNTKNFKLSSMAPKAAREDMVTHVIGPAITQ